MTEAKPSRLRVWMVKGFLLSVAVLLIFTATFKLFGQPPDMGVRLTPDPVVSFLKSRDMVAFAMLLEYVIGFYLIFGRNQRLKLAAVLALTLGFVWYRLGLYIFGFSTSCHCLGTLANAFAAETPVRYILYGMLLYMGGGSVLGLWLNGSVPQNHQSTTSKGACAVLCLLTLYSANSAQGQINNNLTASYEVEGKLHCTYYTGTNIIATNQVYKYHLWHYNANRWKIRSYVTHVNYYEIGCDGTNTFTLFYEPRADLPAMAAQIHEGCFPPGPYPVTQPWFAYLSSAFVRTNNCFPALWGVPDPLAQLFEADIQMLDRPPFLPKVARWKVSERRVMQAQAIMDEIYPAGMPTTVRMQLANLKQMVHQYRDVHVSYAAENVTNIGGMSLPLRYRLSLYKVLKGPGVTNELRNTNALFQSYPKHIVDFVGAADRISAASEDNVLPLLPIDQRIDVADGRFRHTKYKIPGIQYSITNEWIVDAMSPRLLAISEAKIKEKKKYDFSPAKAAFCAGMVCLPVLVLVLLRKAKEPRQKSKLHEINK